MAENTLNPWDKSGEDYARDYAEHKTLLEKWDLLHQWSNGVPWDLMADTHHISTDNVRHQVDRTLAEFADIPDQEDNYKGFIHNREIALNYRKDVGLDEDTGNKGEHTWASVYGIDNWWWPFKPKDNGDPARFYNALLVPLDEDTDYVPTFTIYQSPHNERFTAEELYVPLPSPMSLMYYVLIGGQPMLR